MIAVVGAGTIGRGVTQTVAQAGYETVLVDCSLEALDAAGREIRQQVRLSRLFQRSGPTESPDAVMGRIALSTDLQPLRRARFVIENVTERWSIKQGLYRELDAACPADCIFAANTSAIPIARLAAVTSRAPLVIGMHFMNPVPLKPVVELIPSRHTSRATLASAQRLLTRLAKQWIIVKDSPGFVSNRVLMVTINEAVCLVHEEVASAADVDDLFQRCFGHKMGPLATADLIGLDTVLLSLEVLLDAFSDDKYRPCPLLREMVGAGQLGKKAGAGFYTY
jgi:3-hydroxybutyryl-CoA dehydrogenase